jgi:hypothetical protein
MGLFPIQYLNGYNKWLDLDFISNDFQLVQLVEEIYYFETGALVKNLVAVIFECSKT